MQTLPLAGVFLTLGSFVPMPDADLEGLWQNPDGLIVRIHRRSDSKLQGSIVEPEPRWSAEHPGRRSQIVFRGELQGHTLRGQFFPGLSPAESTRCQGMESRTTDFELSLQENGNLEGWFDTFNVDRDCKPTNGARQNLVLQRLRYESESRGECMTRSFADPENQFEMHSRYGSGFSASAHGAKTRDTQLVTTSIEVDSIRGTTHADFTYTWISESPIQRSTRQPLPTLDSVRAYLRALPPERLARFFQKTGNSVLATLALLPDGPVLPPPPDADPDAENLYGTPKILWVNAEYPIPGGIGSIVGIFPPEGELTATANGKALDISRRTQSRLSFFIPQDAREKIEIVVTRVHEGRRYPSLPQKLLVYQNLDEAPGWVRNNLDSQIQGFLEGWLFRESTLGLSRAISTFTAKKGRFRYPIFSAQAEGPAEIKGCRWLVVIQGEFRNRYKDATFELLIALVPPGQEDAFVDNLDNTGLQLVSVGKLQIRKNEDGQKVFTFEVTNRDLAEKLGLGSVSFNQDQGSISLSKFFHFNLEEENALFLLNPNDKSISLSIRKDHSLLSVRASEEKGISLSLSENESRVVNNRRHEYQRSFEEVNGDIGTTISGTIRDRADPGSPILLTYRIALDDRARERAEGIANLDASATVHLFDTAGRQFGTVESKGALRENKLDSAAVRYRHAGAGPLQKLEFGFAYQREQNEKLWKLDGNAKGEIGEIDLEFGLFSSLEAKTDHGIHTLNSIRITGGVEAEFDVKKLGVQLKVGGEYKRDFHPQEQETFRVFGSGTLAYKKVELIVEGGYGNLQGREQGEVSAGLDLGGFLKTAARLAGHEQRIDLFKSE